MKVRYGVVVIRAVERSDAEEQMIVDRVVVEGFKSIAKVDIECGRVNVLVGDANAGKSNLIEALALFSLKAAGENSLARLVRHTSPEDLFHLYDMTRPALVEAGGWQASVSRGPTGFSVAFALSGKLDFEISCASDGGTWTKTRIGQEQHDSPFRLYRYERQPWTPPRNSEFLLPPDGSNLPVLLRTNVELRDAVTDLLVPYGIRLARSKTHGEQPQVVEELPDKTPMVYPFDNLSDTLRRCIFYTAALMTCRDSVVLLEEPEVHSVPYYVKFLAERIALDRGGNQFFIVTHNPYMLQALLAKTPEAELKVLLVRRENLATTVRPFTSNELSEAADLGVDLFFNLDRFCE